VAGLLGFLSRIKLNYLGMQPMLTRFGDGFQNLAVSRFSANLRRFVDQRGTPNAKTSHWDNSALLGRSAQPVFDAFQEPQVHLQRQFL
jgi:hypothetical protein